MRCFFRLPQCDSPYSPRVKLSRWSVGLSYHGSRNHENWIIVSAKLFCQGKSISLQKIERQCHTIYHNGNRRVPHGTITMAEGIS